ncbi:MAG: hypothetical protein HY286_08940 [Planctomycetes bacterium]|nr:hypothetical protein [Planctomycetota bacterium]
MKSFLLLAEHFSDHPDSTFSVLRCGIDKYSFRADAVAPFFIEGTLVVRILADPKDHGSHKAALRLVDSNGMDTIPMMEPDFSTNPSGGWLNICIIFKFPMQAIGRYTFMLTIDSIQMDTYNIYLETPK